MHASGAHERGGGDGPSLTPVFVLRGCRGGPPRGRWHRPPCCPLLPSERGAEKVPPPFPPPPPPWAHETGCTTDEGDPYAPSPVWWMGPGGGCAHRHGPGEKWPPLTLSPCPHVHTKGPRRGAAPKGSRASPPFRAMHHAGVHLNPAGGALPPALQAGVHRGGM
ncbi:hypothetical protein V8E53_003036 [Lactarius tabidus]